LLVELANGVLADVEVSVNVGYGYDIRCEVAGETGTVELADTAPVRMRSAGTVGGRFPVDWRERFAQSYDFELRDWVDAVAAGAPPPGPGAWDGLAAQAVADALLTSLRDGQRVAVPPVRRPVLYG
jgi:myo-inositol 2-dehydrogenase/D-chiro-inositol 1-dehydrogenase